MFVLKQIKLRGSENSASAQKLEGMFSMPMDLQNIAEVSGQTFREIVVE